ncbi:M20 aminoacylase family protein [Serratia microhaemolytica]|uniref:M20 aminoacylase family protein n=1 Tax=Serratia microhaemolytica TaxID=2675110 RepID=UPI000FDEC01D|nr:M20 aminoacylase family protein [Serratia microhaemolytica]
MSNIKAYIEKNKEQFIALRRDLHRHPEIGFEEVRTSDIVAEKLLSWGYQVDRGMATTGIVATLTVGDGKKTLGLRSDLDALPMQENSGKEWQSCHEGKFHGCGHDGHTAILLCAAEYLAKTRNFNGTLHLIFQPAEELLYGGKKMLEDGLFEKFPCDHIFALHNMPGMKTGSFHFRKGPMMASSDTIHIEVNGVGGHGALPEYTIDATVVACHIVLALQTIVSRNVTPFQPAVVTVGSIQSGAAPNIINAKALLKLSIRTLDPQVRHQILQRVTEIATAQAQSFGASADVIHINGSPVLINDADATEFAISVARQCVDESMINTDTAPVMGSEDFAFMLEENPNGSYLLVGAGDQPGGCMVHNPGYDFNDELIVPAATYWCTLVENYLK